MGLGTGVSELIKRIYSAGEDRSAWDTVLVEVFQLVGACAGVASLVDFGRMRVQHYRLYGPQHNGHSGDLQVEKLPEDPVFKWAAKNPGCRYCDSRAILAREEYYGHPFVEWASATLGSAFWYSGCSAPANGLTFCAAAHFSGDRQDRAQQFEQFQLLFDHMECAMRLGKRGFSNESARALIRLGDDGRVEQVSKGAERLLSDRPAITIADGRLLSAGPEQQTLVDRALDRVLPKRNRAPRPTAVMLKREQGRPWIVVLRPVAEDYGAFGKVHRQVDVELLDRIPEVAGLDVVQSLFDLTGRELQVLRLLMQGHSIDSLSATIEISRNTTRAHLRSIYTKTRTNSQSELMHLCGSLGNAAFQSERETSALFN